MADISVRRTHGMELDDAKQKVESIVDEVQDEFSSLVNKIDWSNDKSHAEVTGKGFSGQFEVDEDEVSVDINLKMFARPFKGKVKSRIDSRMDEYFGDS